MGAAVQQKNHKSLTALGCCVFICAYIVAASGLLSSFGRLLLRIGGDFDPRGGTNFLLVAARRHHLQIPYRALLQRGLSDSWLSRPGRKEADIWTDISRLSPDQWALLWSFKYTRFKQLPQLAPHHRVNHFPENGGLVMKSALWKTYQEIRSKSLGSVGEFMPDHYILPADLPAFIRRWDADKTAGALRQRWIFKSQQHRGVSILQSMDQIDELLSQDNKHKKTMVAQYIDPLLIGKRKWDIGLYVAVTSLSPLMIYIYDNALLRFCKKPYPVGDIDAATPVDSYVVNEYLPPWEMDGLRELYAGNIPSGASQGTSNMRVLLEYLKRRGIDPQQLQKQLEKIVVSLVEAVAPKLRAASRRYSPHDGTFFELFRWDFVLSKAGKPYLMEVNMSPNLKPKRFASGNDEALKRGVVEDLMSLLGVNGRSATTLQKLRRASSIAPAADVCTSNSCSGCPERVEACVKCISCFPSGGHVRARMMELVAQLADRGKFSLVQGTTAQPSTASRSETHMAASWLLTDTLLSEWNPVTAGIATANDDAGADISAVPSVPVLCLTRNDCSGHGDCVNGHCQCDVMWDGDHCLKTKRPHVSRFHSALLFAVFCSAMAVLCALGCMLLSSNMKWRSLPLGSIGKPKYVYSE